MRYIKPPDFKSVKQLGEVYKKIEQDITGLLTTDASARTANELNQKIGQAISAAVSYLSNVNKDYSGKELPKAFKEGQNSVQEEKKVLSQEEASAILEKQGFRYAKNGFSRDTYIELQNATKSAGNGLKTRVNTIIKDLAKTGQDTVYNVQQAIIKDLEEHSVLEIEYTNGAKMPLSAYATMAARSARIESTNIGAIGRALQGGTDLVEMTTMPQCCKLCGAYQDKVYSISGNDKRFPALFKTVLKNGYALPHPNCRHEFIPYYEEIEDPEDVKKDIAKSKIKYDSKGNLVDVRHQADIEGYQAWQAGNRQLNRELQEYEQMQAYYESKGLEAPYKTLGAFRRARRAQAQSYKDNRKNWHQGLTSVESDVIITNQGIKVVFGENAATLQKVLGNADPIIANAFKKYQEKLIIADAHYKTTQNQSAHFAPGKGVFFDIDEDAKPSNDVRKQYQTYFHEIGHNFDYLIGKKFSYYGEFASTAYKSSRFVEEHLRYNKEGKIIGKTITKMSFDDMIKKEGQEFIDAYRKVVENRTNKKASDIEVYQEIFNDFNDELIVNKRQLSDILDGITNGDMLKKGYDLGATHTRKTPNYWEKHPVGVEAFAHFTSALSINPKAAEKLINIFEKSFIIYKEIFDSL